MAILNTTNLDQSIAVPFDQAVASADPQFSKNPNQYSVGNPHPGYGKDPNILNELGHTKYPMWVNGEIANNAEDEARLRGTKVEETKLPDATNGWTA